MIWQIRAAPERQLCQAGDTERHSERQHHTHKAHPFGGRIAEVLSARAISGEHIVSSRPFHALFVVSLVHHVPAAAHHTDFTVN